MGTHNFQMARARCLFPSYIFVHTDGLWRFLLSTFGIVGIVLRGEGPDYVRPDVIAQIKAREDKTGFIQLPVRKHGDTIRVKSGPFQDRQGIYLGDTPSGRVRVLLDVMGRKTRCLFDERQVADV